MAHSRPIFRASEKERIHMRTYAQSKVVPISMIRLPMIRYLRLSIETSAGRWAYAHMKHMCRDGGVAYSTTGLRVG